MTDHRHHDPADGGWGRAGGAGGGRRGRRGGGPPFGPPFGPGFGPGFEHGFPGGRGRGRGRMRRGDVRSALLIALLDGPGHGYELIQNLEEKTDGRWRPSPGSVYPALQLLTDEGLVTATERDGKRIFELTDAGRTEATNRVESQGYPWETMDRGPEGGGLRIAVRDLHAAAKQVGLTGTREAVEQATAIVTQARKELYRLLADA